MVYAGKALFLRNRNEEEVVAELAEKNVGISPREVSYLGMKFVTYLAMAHRKRGPEFRADMRSRGGYICHLDATCEGGNPLLMSSIDSLSDIVLGNVKLPAEDEAHIVPFLKRIRKDHGTPLALVHDMGKGILSAVAKVFPDVPEFICHFHFLRDIGKDFMGAEYDAIRKRLRAQGIGAKLRYRAKQLKAEMDKHPGLIRALETAIGEASLPEDARRFLPVVNTYTLIQWALRAKSEGRGYGFPFDHPHLAFAKRIREVNRHIENIKDIHLRGDWKDNRPYFKLHADLKNIMKDRTLWTTVEKIEERIIVFDKLREAMRIAPKSGGRGLNDEGRKGNIRTIEKRVETFRTWMTTRHDYPQNPAARNMIKQIDKYWEKLFADPITVQTSSGRIRIQPQRTNNILEQFFRGLKRANRRRTGNASSRRMLQTILAETPLVRNLKNPAYMKILLHGEPSLESVFSNIDIELFREAFRVARDAPEKIPAKLKPLIAMPDFPVKLANIIERAVA
ncbi:MAG: transposase [Verrucomicrobia bacterium]|jgi:transposase-like protein|nr:transposase [Verrucomicrobiota bacterium]